MRHQPAARAGFTLVEVLIVISIIATLAAISVGVFFQLRGSQDSSVTEVTLNKLHSTFDGKYKAVLDEAKKSVPPALVTLCGNDPERAKVVWTRAKLINEFPEAKAEATTTLMLAPGVFLSPRRAFAATAAALPADDTSATGAGAAARARTSSALMYVALSQLAGSGTMAGTEGLQQQTRNEGNVQFFVDSWGQPIGFMKRASNTEIAGNDFSRPNRVTIGGTPVDIRTPFDPLGRMIEHPNNLPFRTAFNAVGLSASGFDNVNTVATFYSAGPNKEFGSDPVSLTIDEALDNLLSYRLRREGARGD